MMQTYLPWLLSAFTIYIAWVAGSKSKHTWAVGLVAQVLWFTWIVMTENWGLLPGNFALAAIYARNHLKGNAS